MSEQKQIVKTCENCAYARGAFDNYGKCLKTGFFQTIQRQMPDSVCDKNFSGWAPKDGVWPPEPPAHHRWWEFWR